MAKNTPEVHPGWNELIRRVARQGVSRRQFLGGVAGAAGTMALAPLFRGSVARASLGPVTPGLSLPDQAAWPHTNPIKHVVILCQENRSFDHYFGKFGAAELGTTNNRPDVFDPLVAYANSSGTQYRPFHIESFCDFDPDHGWDLSHAKWNGGAMDGWVKGEVDEQPLAIGYFDAADHIYHLQLAQAFTMADHYFCSQISQTLPNRLYLWTGTSGWEFLSPADTSGLPYNNPSVTEVPPTLDWPTMADVLEAQGLPWKCYSVADGSVPTPVGAFNPLIFFKSIQGNPVMLAKALAGIEQFFVDLALGTLPAVSWIVTQEVVCEHPPAPPDMGQLLVGRVARALMESSAWDSSVLFINYDEGGGYFDHVPPAILDYVPTGLPDAGNAIGPAFRVPMTVVSPFAKKGSVFKDPLDHTSVLQFIEKTFNVPAVVPINAARRNPNAFADLRDAFDFNQSITRPLLPAPEDLFAFANETVVTSDIHRGVIECTTTIPRWLPPLLGQPPVFPYPTPPPV